MSNISFLAFEAAKSIVVCGSLGQYCLANFVRFGSSFYLGWRCGVYKFVASERGDLMFDVLFAGS